MEWIRVKDRLPEVDDDVLLLEDPYIFVGRMSKNHIYHIRCDCYEGSSCFPTHWMPLPEVPND